MSCCGKGPYVEPDADVRYLYHEPGEKMVTRVDPFTFTNYNRTYSELESMLLFSIIVAGKTADFGADKLKGLMGWAGDQHGRCPFERIRFLIDERLLEAGLRSVRTGQYVKLEKALRHVCGGFAPVHESIDLRSCELHHLMAIPGVGPKTARMFLLHSRARQRLAVLDTHILKFLAALPSAMKREHGVRKVPTSTPAAGRQYERLEALFLHVADQRRMNPSDLDLQIWTQYTKSKGAR